MKPLNYAILKFFTKVEQGSVKDVMNALKEEYSQFKAFNASDILIALMTAEVNGLLEEASYQLDADNELEVYFRAHEEGAATINKYIRD